VKAMKKLIITLIAIILAGCSSSEKMIDIYPEPIVKLPPETKKPDWVSSTKAFWYTEKDGNGTFFLKGEATSSDFEIALASSKAIAAKNIAEYVQARINSYFGKNKTIDADSTRLIIEMVAEKVKLSIATVEYYYEKYLEFGRPKYVVYTLNSVSKNSVDYALDEILKGR
jgi:hypothetical protein